MVYASRFPPLPQVIDVIPKESKLKVGRLNNLAFENQKIKEYDSRIHLPFCTSLV